jgi:hypothetical protein
LHSQAFVEETKIIDRTPRAQQPLSTHSSMHTINKSPNSELIAYIDRYCTSATTPGYAVLLAGPWGCGKTWFLSALQERLKKCNPTKRCLYVSLFGVSSPRDVEQQFFQQLHPKLSNPKVQKGWAMLKNFLKGTVKVDIDGDGKDEGSLSFSIPDLGDWVNTEGAILVFDDLERCSMSPKDALGYINQFVEHDGYRVIIAANEDECLRSQPDFATIKEKVIGRTFAVEPEFHSALEQFVEELQSDKAHVELKSRLKIVERVYTRAGYRNLRQVRQALFDFADLWSCLPPVESTRRGEFVDRLVADICSVAIECRAGTVKSGAVEDWLTRQSIHEIIKEAEDPDHEPSASDLARSKHDLLEGEMALQPSAYGAFFANGRLSEEAASQSLTQSAYLVDEHTPAWRRLWNYMILTEEEFARLRSDMLQRFLACEYKEEGELLHVVALLLSFAKDKLHPMSIASTLKSARHVVKKLELMDAIRPGPKQPERRFRDHDSAYGMGYRDAKTEEFKSFKQFYQARVAAVREKKMRLWVNEWMGSLTTSDTATWCLRLDVHGNADECWFGHQFVFHLVQPTLFLRALRKAGAPSVHAVYYALRSRYETLANRPWLLDEVSFLVDFVKLLEQSPIRRKREALATHYLRDWMLPMARAAVERLGTFRQELGAGDTKTT